MAQKVESYASKDGRLFPTERQADLADIEKALRSANKPHLVSSISVILREAEFLAEVLGPISSYAKGPIQP